MDISKIDKNFILDANIPVDDLAWYNADEVPFSLYGGFHDENGYYRMPRDIAAGVSEGVSVLNNRTAGIRVRFKTNSPYIALCVKWDCYSPMNHMPASGSSGFDLYKVKNGLHRFVASFMVANCNPQKNADGFTAFKYLNTPDKNGYSEGELADYILNFPLYNGVRELYIGIKNDSALEVGNKYKNNLPVVFYGSSITQGGCASRPGNCYQNFISRALDIDYINLGFSGNGKAEDTMAEYLKSLKMSIFVSDYDHNAPNAEHLKNTHYKLYEKIRAVNPNLPYVIISKPDYHHKCDWERRATVFETFKKAIALGDENVYFIDGASLFGGDESDACTVDGTHPNDLGFYRMAEGITPIIKHILSR